MSVAWEQSPSRLQEQDASKPIGSVSLLCGLVRLSRVDPERVRLARRATNQVLASGSAGFTLVELLVVIVVLGVLSAVVVFGLGGFRSRSQASACAEDRSRLETAMEAYRAQYGSYATEAGLVAAAQLRRESSLHDVVLGGGDYTVAPVGVCIDGGGSSSSTSTTTTTAAPTTTTRPLRALSLTSLCTPRSHWPGERAWRIQNRNIGPVSFVLTATDAPGAAGSPVVSDAPAGNSTWYLPAASRGRNPAVLDAVGRRISRNSNNRRC